MIYQAQCIDEFLSISQSTKNLSANTLTAYRSDLKDFYNYSSSKEFDENIIISYIQYLSHIQHLKDSSIKRKLITLKLFLSFYQNITT